MREGEKARILVVDDEEAICKSIKAVLEEKGYLVDTVENGQTAITKSQTETYNLALIDIRLPDMEGTSLLTSMRETTPKMVKIMITGYPSLQNAIEAVERGADGYLIKPVNMAELLAMIKEHLKKQQETKKFSEAKVAEFIRTRSKELESGA